VTCGGIWAHPVGRSALQIRVLIIDTVFEPDTT
jgi:hypothetical protein